LTERFLQWSSRVWNDVPRQPVQPAKGFDVLPDEVIGMIGKLNTNPALIHTSHKVHDIVQDEFREKLNEACLKDPQNVGKKPSVLFANPANRLGQHVPSDPVGLRYLKVTYGIGNQHQFLINQIKEGLPIAAAAKTIRDNRGLVHEVERTDLQYLSLIYPRLAGDIESGLLTRDHVLKLMADPMRKIGGLYGNEQIRKYLEKGDLCTDDLFNPRYRDGLALLCDYPEIEPYMNKEHMQAFLRFDRDARLQLRLCCLRHPDAVGSFLADKFSR